MKPRHPAPVRFAAAVFGLAARILPKKFNRAFGDDVRGEFLDEAMDAYRSGGSARLAKATMLALVDVARSRRTETLRPRGRRLTGFSQDLRYALRMFRRQPAFALTATLMLAVGIGGNTAVFSLVNAALLRPLPYPDSDRLVRVWGARGPNADRGPVSPVDAGDWARGAPALEGIAVWTSSSQPMTGAGDPTIVPVAFTTSALLPLLRVTPLMGSDFGPQHDAPGRENEILITRGFWHRVLGGNPAVIGSVVRLADVACTVIGVLPASFVSPGIRSSAEPQIWRPLVVDPGGRGAHFVAAVGRLRDGVSVSEAQAQLDLVTRRLEQQFPSTNTGQSAHLQPLRAALAADARTPMLMLMTAVGIVLLIACANVANLLLSNVEVREREIALRGALGASRGRIVRQLATESLLLAAAATALGSALGVLALRLVPAWVSDQLPAAITATLDPRALVVTVVFSFATVMVFGLMPALVASKFDVRGALASASAGGGVRRRPLQSVLVVAEAALALILLVSATMLVQSLTRLQRVDPGFTTAETLTFRLSLPRARYPEAPRRIAFLESVEQKLQALPGVVSAGGVNTSPLSGRYSCDSFALADRAAPPEGQEPCAEVKVASPGYFNAMGIPLIAGRHLAASDTSTTSQVAVISDSMARRYWPEGNPVGQRLKWGSLTSQTPWLTIVGVVGNVKHFGLGESAPDDVYMPLKQRSLSAITFAARVNGRADALQDAVRTVVREADPGLPVAEVLTTRQLVSKSVALPAFRTSLLAAFAILALVLSVTGVYGLMAFHVAQRRREIGIRLALGAHPHDVQRQVIAHGMALAGVGCLIGIAAAIPLMKLMRSLLFGVSATDPLAYVVATVLLGITALLASYIPARRVTAVSPVETIRLP
jgi:predicted permease